MKAVEIVSIEVQRKDLLANRLTTRASEPLEEGSILVEVEKFALTANNVSYGVSGDFIGYWKFFPVDEPWGIIPVWGFARVLESRAPGIEVGNRIWGFLPMASHAVLRPSDVSAASFVDDSPHRRDLPGLYNVYQRTEGDSRIVREMEDERCVLLPLFTTSFVIADWLGDNGFFGAKQVVIVSASSKTGFGLANLLARLPGHPVRVVGLTSPGNRAFVESLATCDEVRVYDEIERMDAAVPTAVVDMAGSAKILRTVHEHFRDNLVSSCFVGVTHWNAKRHRGDLPGATPTFFFAPAQIAKRDDDWGRGELLRRALGESLRVAAESSDALAIIHVRGGEACRAALDEMIAGRTPPSRGVMMSLAGG